MCHCLLDESSAVLLKPAIQSAGFHPVGKRRGKREREREEKRNRRERERQRKKERDRERKRERCMVWELKGACTFLCCIASDQYSPTSRLNYLRALDKTMQYQ